MENVDKSVARPTGRGRGRTRDRSPSVTRLPGGARTMAKPDQSVTSSGSGGSGGSSGGQSVAQSTQSSQSAQSTQSSQSTQSTGSALSIMSMSSKQSVAGSTTSAASAKSTGSAKSAGSSSSTDSNDSTKFVSRPEYGKLGRQIALRTNNFFVNFDNTKQLYFYSVEIKSEFRECKFDDSFAAFWEADRKYHFITEPYTAAFDGAKACYSTKKLDLEKHADGKLNVEVGLPRMKRRQQYTVELKFINMRTIDFEKRDTKTEALAVLEMVYRQWNNMPDASSRQNRFSPFGPNFFYHPKPGDRTSVNLEGGKEAWSGYYLAAKWATGNIPILNIDISNGIFAKPQPMLSMLCESLNEAAGRSQFQVAQLERLTTPYRLSRLQVETFEKCIKSMQVQKIGQPARAWKVKGVTLDAAEQLMFDWKKKDQPEQKISVADYYTKQYSTQLRFPFFPCLEVADKKLGGMYFPLELMELVSPQRMRGKLTEAQTATLIKGVCTDAVERSNRISEMMTLASLFKDPFAQKFGFGLKLSMMELMGRVLSPPSLEYNQNAKITPREGSWNMGSAKLYAGGSIPCYGLVSFVDGRSTEDLKNFCGNLMSTASKMGMHVGNQYPTSVVFLNGNSVGEIRIALQHCVNECSAKGQACGLILVPMSARSSTDYANLKAVAEQEIGVITQVVLMRNIRQPKPQTLSNIVLKLNAKVGGVNCKIYADILANRYLVNQPTLVIGVDVTHATVNERKTPSIGAAVGNIDMLPGKFSSSVNVQRYHMESVIYMKKGLEDRVAAFWQNAHVKPERIIVYRDGVDEGYFNNVMEEECKSIRHACQHLMGPDFEPKITFIIVQKRHHTRFFCANQNDMSGRGKNVPAGTVVDHKATHAVRFDFYLCSHYGIQGTSRPAHYQVLRDDSGFTSDELQALTFYLTHIYARCTRSVSIPAPTYYAHLACERARHHLTLLQSDPAFDWFGDDSSSVASGSSGDDGVKEIKVAESLTSKMYFC